MSSSPSHIDINLLQALLSPTTTQIASQTYAKIPIENRITSILSLLTTTTNNTLPPEAQLLSATLLRQNVGKIQNVSRAIIEQTLNVLLHLFFTSIDSSSNPQTTAPLIRAYSHAIAECVLSLSLTSQPQASLHVIPTVLRQLYPKMQTLNASCWRLFCDIVNRSPVSFWRYGAREEWVMVLRNAVDEIVAKGGGVGEEVWEVIVMSVCEVGVAGGVAESGGGGMMGSGGEEGKTTVDVEVMNAVLAQTPSFTSVTETTLLSPTSPIPTLGHQLLSPLLPTLPSLPPPILSRLLTSLSTLILRSPSFLSHPTTLSLMTQNLLVIAGSGAAAADLRCQSLSSLTCMLETPLLPHLLTISEIINAPFDLVLPIIIAGYDEDISSWMNDSPTLEDSTDDDDDDDSHHFACEILYGMIHAFKNHFTTTPSFSTRIDAFLTSEDWRVVCGGLTLLSFLPSECPSIDKSLLVTAGLRYASAAASLPRVQWSAIRLLSDVCVADGDGEMRERFGREMMSVVEMGLRSSVAKIVVAACLMIVSYCRGDDEEDGGAPPVERIEGESVNGVLRALCEGPLGSGHHVVLVRGIGAVACLASALGEEFTPYYGQIMPGLWNCLTSAAGSNDPSSVAIRGAALEAATIVGQAVPSLFTADVPQVMTLAMPLLDELKRGCDVGLPSESLLASCARVATVMEEDFAPYLPPLLDLLLAKAKEEADVSFSPADELSTEHDDGDGETLTLSIPGRGPTKLTINTIQMTEKAQCARAVYELASSLPSSFGPYCPVALEAFIPSLTVGYAPEVRRTAAQTIGAIMGCCDGETVGRYAANVVTVLMEQRRKEDDYELLLAFAEAMSDVIHKAYKSQLPLSPTFLSPLIQFVSDGLNRRNGLLATLATASSEDTRDMIQQELERESEGLTPLVDCIGWILKSNGSNCGSLFEAHVSSFLTPLLGNADLKAREIGISLLDDVIEFGDNQSVERYAPRLLPVILSTWDNIKEGHDDLRFVCLYGLSLMARRLPSLLVSHEQLILGHAMMVLSDVDGHSALVTECAAGVLGSMVLMESAKFQHLRSSEMIGHFLKVLPMREDEDEAKINHEVFCHLFQSGGIDVHTLCGDVVRVIGEGLLYQSQGEDIVTEEIGRKFVVILKSMRETIDGAMMQQVFDGLEPEVQMTLSTAMAE